ncbi:VaFE repeat-containing surface-anchored protein [Microbacterium sp. NPDC057944]|uniref:VaFE repeat-containing surface-anchored protein n=1 Tax=Microbacterium sp. NPDC057944 TaxID=3346286 RepID=UPI0036DC1DF5
MKTTASTRKTRAGRGAAALLLALTALIPAAFAAPAVAATDIAPGDPVWVGTASQGYSGTAIRPVYVPVPTDTANPGTADYWAYCIEHDVSRRTGTSAVVGDFSSYLGANLFTTPAVQAKVHWVLTHSYPAIDLVALQTAAGVTNLSVSDAVEATQYAIWRYTDLGWDAAWAWETPNSEAVYWYLVNGANADQNQTPPTTADIDVSVAGPAGSGAAGSLFGPFTVSTNQATAAVTSSPAHAFTDAAGSPINANAVVDGQQVFLDLRGSTVAGSATVTATVAGADGTGLVVSTPVVGSTTPTAAAHRQSQILVAASTATTSASAQGAWAAAAVPAIGTTLTDAADEDHVLAWNGGSLIDTIAYTGLTVGQQYTVSGELMVKADASATGITGATTFTPTAADGTVEVSFTVPSGYAGESLVAFEALYEGATATGTPVAVHEDIEDVDQTVAVLPEPSIGTLATTDNPADDKVLLLTGGTVTDTVSYRDLEPNTLVDGEFINDYVVGGELMLVEGGVATPTGITAESDYFTVDAGATSGDVDVVFTLTAAQAEQYAGKTLVVYETLYRWRYDLGVPVRDVYAVHHDAEDAGQTFVVESLVPAIGTTLVDAADEDHALAWNGGSLIDTIAYTGLTVGQEYTVAGELMLKADGSATGITGETTFTPTSTDGTVDVTFVVPVGYAGQSLVAFETLYSGGEATGTPVAEHRDIDDVDQTVAVEAQPLVPAIGTTLLDGADQDHTLAWGGGTVIDTIAYTGLTPGVEYTVAGELMRKSDGSATGITATATFTPTASTGSIAVSFTVPTGYAGSTLVAFETLYVGATASGTPVAAHTDIEDAAQTVVVEKQPAAPAGPSTGSNGSTGGLAATGGALPVVLTAAGVVAILLGTIALIRQRRTRDQV